MQTKNDFRFIIPYVEFAKEVKGLKPCILDTSVVIDGRIADVVETQIFDGQLIMPQVRHRRAAGDRRQLRPAAPQPRPPRAGHPQPPAGQPRDRAGDLRPRPARVRRPAGRSEAGGAGQAPQGKLVTNDYNLNKVARLQGVDGDQPQRPGQRAEARVPAGRAHRGAHRQGGRRGRPRRRLSRRRHDGRRRRRAATTSTRRSRSPSPACCKPAPAAWSSASSKTAGRTVTHQWPVGSGRPSVIGEKLEEYSIANSRAWPTHPCKVVIP